MHLQFDDKILPARFWDKVIPEPNSGCWLWVGATSSKGYSSFRHGSKRIAAHRFVVEALVELPAEAEIDHRCENKICVNPMHLDVVSHQENVQRYLTKHKYNATHCSAGHDLAIVGRYPAYRRGKKLGICRACQRANSVKYIRRRRESVVLRR